LTKATVLTDRLDRVLLYATHVHGGQVRKGTSTPYVAHLLEVAATVPEYGGDEVLAIAALLHDSVKDQGGKARLDDVATGSARAFARIVEACSDSLADTGKGERKVHWRERSSRALTAFCDKIAELNPQLVTFNGNSFDLPVLRYRAMVHGVSAPGLSMRPYFHRYTEDAIDLCDVFSSFSPQGKASLHEISRLMGLPGKPKAFDGGEVERYFREGKIKRSPTTARPT
jgi:hypothetical protein